MGQRELKRVPLDFRAPLDKVWNDYINPHRGPRACVCCGESGYNAATKQIDDDFYDFDDLGNRWCDKITQDEVQVLVEKNRLWDFTRIPLTDKQMEDVRLKIAAGGNSWLPYNNGRVPTAEEVNARHFGHDAINRWILVEARAKRLGVYGNCPACHGKGSKFPPHVPHRPYKAWKLQEPPKGEGYQLWETTSEGTPISPVFNTAEALADWCAKHATVFASETTSRENWLRMFSQNAVDTGCTLVGMPGYVGAIANIPVD